jgi:hypothetical protein
MTGGFVSHWKPEDRGSRAVAKNRYRSGANFSLTRPSFELACSRSPRRAERQRLRIIFGDPHSSRAQFALRQSCEDLDATCAVCDRVDRRPYLNFDFLDRSKSLTKRTAFSAILCGRCRDMAARAIWCLLVSRPIYCSMA